MKLIKGSKKCKYPGCKRETYKSDAYFCLEHSRTVKDAGKKTLGFFCCCAVTAVGVLYKKPRINLNDNILNKNILMKLL